MKLVMTRELIAVMTSFNLARRSIGDVGYTPLTF